jgi:uncharacterized protein YydD (DUF2326 family)
MFLRSLEILNNNIVIRNIKFIKGINLIVDETNRKNRTSSGNGVGKTTVLRLIDFCLDGKGENIYLDPEFRTHNATVENFLKENNVLIRLTLIEDINKPYSPELIIEKNFLDRSNKIQKINGEQYGNKEFSSKLKELIFKTDIEQPTFKQMKAKNIRDEKYKIQNTIRVLPPNVVTDATYETLHLFWFGIDADLSKDKLSRELTFEKRIQTRLRKTSNLSQINQALIIINRNIDELEGEKVRYNINDNYQSDLTELNRIRKEKNILSTEISRLELRYDLVMESKKNMERDIASIDTEAIKRMYQKAKVLIPDLQKSFEDIIIFHNGMLKKKIAFITDELPSIEKELEIKRSNMMLILSEEASIVDKMNSSILLEDLQKIINNLNDYYERKGILQEQKRNWEESNQKIKQLESDIASINNDLTSRDEVIQKRIAEFNVIFSDISNKLDGVHLLLSADNSNGMYKFEISNVESNPGTGTKKSQMASFDLAYIKYADSLKIPCLHFILQDQIETVHSNQIINLLTEIIDDVNCQYVLPVLRDKLPRDIDTSIFEILKLSQSERLFKI